VVSAGALSASICELARMPELRRPTSSVAAAVTADAASLAAAASTADAASSGRAVTTGADAVFTAKAKAVDAAVAASPECGFEQVRLHFRMLPDGFWIAELGAQIIVQSVFLSGTVSVHEQLAAVMTARRRSAVVWRPLQLATEQSHDLRKNGVLGRLHMSAVT